jgi:squalene-associated FAD-dependent desaturase
MPSVIVVGGGLAGMAATAALASAGFDVQLFESRPYLGGRATSYAIPAGDGANETIDNCQHILLRCCVNLLDFYKRLGVLDQIEFHREFYFIEPGGRTSVFRAGVLPKPLHFTGSFLAMQYLTVGEKIALVRGLLRLQAEHSKRQDLDEISMGQWLREKAQPKRVVERFWRQILVSAINEELDTMSAAAAFQVFWLGFLATRDCYEMGIPRGSLGDLYRADLWSDNPHVDVRLRSGIESLDAAGVRTASETFRADYYISAVPFERSEALTGVRVDGFDHSPITGIHIWFDRRVTNLPHATLLDRTIQWMFNKGEGRYLQLVVSASRSLVKLDRQEVLALALRELAEFFPEVLLAKIERFHVVKELRATYSARPRLIRPPVETAERNVFRAGDWTASGWPSTMEGAVRSGYLAAEAVTRAAGRPTKFVLPDIG